MQAHDLLVRRSAACIVLAICVGSLFSSASCTRAQKEDPLVLKEDIYGFYLGQTKNVVFKRADGVATITKASDPPLGYRGEMWNFSAPLEPHPGISRVRCSFLNGRLWEIIVYFKDTRPLNLDWLKTQLEAQFRTNAVAEDGRIEMAAKTYRLKGPGMSITLRRITKKEGIELYVQYLHDELHKQVRDKNKAIERR